MLQIFLLFIVGIGLLIFLLLSAKDRKVLFQRARYIDHNGSRRKYRIYAPKDKSKIRRAIFIFHGFGSNAWQMAYVTGFHNSVDDDTVVVYPQATAPTKSGQKTGWNAGFCCGSGYVNNVDDVGFIKDLSTYVKEKYSINNKEFFAAGFSNGAMFVNRLATECPDDFAGFASAAGSIGTIKNSLKPKSPAPILLMHGEDDDIVPYAGGPGSTDSNFTWLSLSQSKAAWEHANQARDPQSKLERSRNITTYRSHAHPIEIITYPNKGHQWPGWRLARIWRHQTEGSIQTMKFFLSSAVSTD